MRSAADWTGWLIKATDGLQIAGERDERAGLRAGPADINDQLDTLRHNLVQAEEGIESPELRRDTILKMLKGSADV